MKTQLLVGKLNPALCNSLCRTWGHPLSFESGHNLVERHIRRTRIRPLPQITLKICRLPPLQAQDGEMPPRLLGND